VNAMSGVELTGYLGNEDEDKAQSNMVNAIYKKTMTFGEFHLL
jgi:hypothetical protein